MDTEHFFKFIFDFKDACIQKFHKIWDWVVLIKT